MITKQDILADLHTHTIFSLHAYSTAKENIEEAKKVGLSYIAITDYYYNDGTEINQINETSRIAYMQERIGNSEEDITFIAGTEFNLNQEIVYWNKIKHLKWRPIGLHSWFADLESLTLNDVYLMFVNSMGKHNCLAHIERELHKLNHGEYMINSFNGKQNPLSNDIKLFLEAICLEAKEKNVFLEVNESSLANNDEGYTSERLKYWLTFAKENGNLISLGTDAHYYKEVGKFDRVLNLLNEVDFPKERILNCNKELLDSLKGCN